jgi:hypothetical protein
MSNHSLHAAVRLVGDALRPGAALAVCDACVGWLPLGGLLARLGDAIVRHWMRRADRGRACPIRGLDQPGADEARNRATAGGRAAAARAPQSRPTAAAARRSLPGRATARMPTG